VVHAHGPAVREQQEVLAHAANVIIESYAIESAIGRAQKMERGGSARAPIAIDCARVYTSDAMDRVAHAGKQIINALTGRTEHRDALAAAQARVAAHPGIDTVAARRRISDAAVEAGRYPFS
jgi:hypothetical protein